MAGPASAHAQLESTLEAIRRLKRAPDRLDPEGYRRSILAAETESAAQSEQWRVHRDVRGDAGPRCCALFYGALITTQYPPRNAAPSPPIHAETQIWVAAISRLLSELRRKSVHVHLVVLVVRPWSDGAFNHLTHGVNRFAFPDADAEAVIVGSRMDWQRNVGRKPSFECLGLGGLKAFGVVNSVDDCHKHGLPSIHRGDCAESAASLIAHPTIALCRLAPPPRPDRRLWDAPCADDRNSRSNRVSGCRDQEVPETSALPPANPAHNPVPGRVPLTSLSGSDHLRTPPSASRSERPRGPATGLQDVLICAPIGRKLPGVGSVSS
jgi:hypothetical protein